MAVKFGPGFSLRGRPGRRRYLRCGRGRWQVPRQHVRARMGVCRVCSTLIHRPSGKRGAGRVRAEPAAFGAGSGRANFSSRQPSSCSFERKCAVFEGSAANRLGNTLTLLNRAFAVGRVPCHRHVPRVNSEHRLPTGLCTAFHRKVRTFQWRDGWTLVPYIHGQGGRRRTGSRSRARA